MKTKNIVIEEGENMGDSVQFNSSKTRIGVNNVAKAICTDKKVIFNESYTLVGDQLQCPYLYAGYDLTVNGNIEADDIVVNGKLTVFGNIKAEKINCGGILICQGDINADDVTVGNDIVADSIECKNINCFGNVLVRTTIDISGNLEVDKSVVAGEGIVGDGEFRAQNAVAAEYFSFSGEVETKMIELESDTEIDTRNVNLKKCSLENIVSAFRKKMKEKIVKSIKDEEEKDFVKCICELSEYDKERLNEWEYLIKQIVNDTAYLKSIKNFKDYLFIVAAKHTLPEEVLAYETIEHVFNDFLPKYLNKTKNMGYNAKDIKELAYSLYIVDKYENELKIEKEEALDKIFQSIGLKYQTVKEFMVPKGK